MHPHRTLRRTRASALPLLVIICCLAPPGQAFSSERTAPTSETLQPIHDPQALQVLRTIQSRVEEIRGIRRPGPIPAYYLDSATLRRLVLREVEEQFPERRRQAVEQLLKSLGVVPENFDLMRMYLPLFEEQVGGLYDIHSKRLFVREGFDIVHSEVARLILAHEICHALQDYAFDLASLGVEAVDDDDRSIAGQTVAEGDAMQLSTEYAARWITPDLAKEIPGLLLMDQTALEETPHFFQQELLFPYVQGEALVQEAVARDAGWRNRLFAEPPRTTEQVIHPKKYFERRDTPSSLTLAHPTHAATIAPQGPVAPLAPHGFERREFNHMGELGVRLVLEERLGTGVAYQAAEGWNCDAYAVYGAGKEGGRDMKFDWKAGKWLKTQGKDKWWFCWESVWDSPRDAAEFTGAWITLWRSATSNNHLGDPASADQRFQAGPWSVDTRRRGERVVLTWHN